MPIRHKPEKFWRAERDALPFEPRRLALSVDHLESAGFRVNGVKVMDESGLHYEYWGPVLAKTRKRVFKASAVLAQLATLFDQRTVRLDVVETILFDFTILRSHFLEVAREQGVGWSNPDVTRGKSRARIPAGGYCGHCPYREHRGDMPEQQSGYCGYLEWGDWMSYEGEGMLWDGLKRCGT